jgi:glycine/D-amino acid oxidase-like deaminating enzyme
MHRCWTHAQPASAANAGYIASSLPGPVGYVGGDHNLTVATGHSMLGMTMAPETAVHMAVLITTGNVAEVIEPFPPSRFRGLL